MTTAEAIGREMQRGIGIGEKTDSVVGIASTIEREREQVRSLLWRMVEVAVTPHGQDWLVEAFPERAHLEVRLREQVGADDHSHAGDRDGGKQGAGHPLTVEDIAEKP